MGNKLASLLFGAMAAIFAGISGLLVYETAALWRGTATISDRVALNFSQYTHFYMVGILVLGIAIGALATHFFGWKP